MIDVALEIRYASDLLYSAAIFIRRATKLPVLFYHTDHRSCTCHLICPCIPGTGVVANISRKTPRYCTVDVIPGTGVVANISRKTPRYCTVDVILGKIPDILSGYRTFILAITCS